MSLKSKAFTQSTIMKHCGLMLLSMDHDIYEDGIQINQTVTEKQDKEQDKQPHKRRVLTLVKRKPNNNNK